MSSDSGIASNTESTVGGKIAGSRSHSVGSGDPSVGPKRAVVVIWSAHREIRWAWRKGGVKLLSGQWRRGWGRSGVQWKVA